MARSGGKRGPRPGGPDTRAEILAAAGDVFSRDGYGRGSVRAVARAAGVDPALVRHYFASKSVLFFEAMRPPIDLGAHAARIAQGDPALVGNRVMTFFVELWEDPVRGPRVIALMRAALDYPEVAEFVRKLVIEGVVIRVATEVGAKDPARAAATAASQVFGLAMLRHSAKVEPLASESADSLVERFGPIVTRLLREDTA
ncbi:TetR family transcriptional regulator [Demequina sp.]|uniref:TetR/AcrR family transcriptional regulator n=1 Tax=Demequina sp. TaxID=2050685 RepID=UPI0025BB6902|nr:TetR family transcriptional regulator [Demequina sp.]